MHGSALRAVVPAVLGLPILSAPGRADVAGTWLPDQRGCKLWVPHTEKGLSATWTGSCERGLASGPGFQVRGTDGARVEGIFSNGSLNGRGVETFPDKDQRFDGEFRDGERNGFGVQTWSTDQRFEGEWRNGKRTGRRKVTLGVEGYEGDWVDNKYERRGTYVYKDKSRYEGEWRAGLKDGRGMQLFADGRRYEGEWRDDKPNGLGTFKGSSNTYTGQWRDGCFRGADGSTAAVATTRASCGFN